MREYFEAMMAIIASFSDSYDRRISQMFSNKKRDKLVDSLHKVIKYNKKHIQLASISPKNPDREHITMLEYLQTETDFDEMQIIDTFISPWCRCGHYLKPSSGYGTICLDTLMVQRNYMMSYTGVSRR